MEDELIAFGGEIKALGEGRVGGYLVRFSTPSDPDLTGDYFDAKTNFNLPDDIPLLYNHGMDSTMKKRVIGKAKTRVDEVGVWAESQMNMRDEYEKAIYAMAESGKLGYSSGAISHLVERELAGKAAHIKTWFIAEASLTPTPAEPRNGVMTIKSLITPDAALPDKDDKTNSTKMEKKTMDTNEEIKNLVDAGIAAAMKAQKDAEQAQAARDAEVKAAADAAYKQALEDVRENKSPAFNTKTVLGFSEEKDAVPAFKHWVQTGQVNGGLISPDSSFNIKDAKAAWNVTTGASGGYLVPDPLYNQIIAKRDLASWVRQLPVQSFQTAADHLLVPREDTSNTAFVLTNEAGAYDEDEATVSQKDLILYKYTKLNKVSEEFLMYNATNFESWFSDSMARAVAATENTAFTTGSGSGAPEGIVTGATVANTTATTDVILPAELTALLGYLGNGYNVPSECGLLMNNATKWYLAGYTGNPFLYQSTPAGSPDNLLGYKVVVDDDVVTYTTASSKCIVFGNMNYYGIVEKPGMLVQRNPYLYMANGQVGIFASIFRGGGVLQSEAFYYLTNHS